MLPSPHSKFIMRDGTPLQPSGHWLAALVVVVVVVLAQFGATSQLAQVTPSEPHCPEKPSTVHVWPHTHE